VRTRSAHNELKSTAQDVLDRILRIIKTVGLEPDTKEIATNTLPDGWVFEIAFTTPLRASGRGYIATRFAQPETAYTPVAIEYELNTGRIVDRTTFNEGGEYTGGSLDFSVGSLGKNRLAVATTMVQLLDSVPEGWQRIARRERKLRSRLDPS
jgi:hypothetical protein